MKYLILTLVFFVLGACASKPTTFTDAKLKGKTGTSAISSENPHVPEGEVGGESNDGESNGEPDTIENVDKAIDMGGKSLPDIEGTERSGAVCKRGGDERTISVVDTKEGHCGVVYTKFGYKKTMAFARYEMNFCDEVYNGMVINLDKHGFDCGDAAPEKSGGMEIKVRKMDPSEQTGQTSEPEESVNGQVPGEDTEENETEENGIGEAGTVVEEDQATEAYNEAQVQGDNGQDEPSGQLIDGKTDFPKMEGYERSGATCKQGNDERMISVIDTREGPCGVIYTKFGVKTTEAFAKYDMSVCDRAFNKIIANLLAKGFDCGGVGFSATQEDD